MREMRQKDEMLKTGWKTQWRGSLKGQSVFGLQSMSLRFWCWEKKNLQLYKRVHMWIQFQGTVCHFGSVWKMSVLITEPCCRLFLQNRENNNMDNWKWMQFWTDIAEGISHYRTQINGTKSRGWRHWLFTMYIGKYITRLIHRHSVI